MRYKEGRNFYFKILIFPHIRKQNLSFSASFVSPSSCFGDFLFRRVLLRRVLFRQVLWHSGSLWVVGHLLKVYMCIFNNIMKKFEKCLSVSNVKEVKKNRVTGSCKSVKWRDLPAVKIPSNFIILYVIVLIFLENFWTIITTRQYISI